MKPLFRLIGLCLFLSACQSKKVENPRKIIDFNKDWKFHLGTLSNDEKVDFDTTDWRTLNIPHDWSIEEGYQKEGDVAASTGFVVGGIGWYQKSFTLTEKDKTKQISILFDGVYNNSTVWINGTKLGHRPNGYISFSYDLTPYVKLDGSSNVITIKVDRTTYADSRWYTGSGIYRNVRLIKKEPLHIAQWGVQVTTPKVSKTAATIKIKTQLVDINPKQSKKIRIDYSILNKDNKVVQTISNEVKDLVSTTVIELQNPQLWSTADPNLYDLQVKVFENDIIRDNTTETFGVRTFKFDANTGFSLNREKLKIKGVNLHHDAGAVGSAVPKSIWEYRIKKLQSIGTNAIRLSHNPHSPELLEVCDSLGVLVMAEAFDEWSLPKGKNKVYIGDNAATGPSAKSYPEIFNEWGEKDLRDLIRRDFNHPSIFMWSIGNEIEWTYPHYSKTFNDVNTNSDAEGYSYVPVYDTEKIKAAFDKNIEDRDPLVTIAKKLVQWVKEEDITRPTVCGSVLPSVSIVSGYGTSVDVLGFNYRQADYDIAHQTYPSLKIIGTENWGNYKEWKMINDRDFVAGIFAWTGFAYLGEAGPWPRKGLNISFFDYAGFKTPRGHFYETLWKEDPKIYMVTTPASESEFSFTKQKGWHFNMHYTAPPIWKMLRLWEWYKVYPKWKYDPNEDIIVQAYTNCEEAELFLDNISLGKQKRKDFADDNIIKWLVPFKSGKLRVVGYNKNVKADEYFLETYERKVTKIYIESTKSILEANGYDTAIITVKLLDENNNLIPDLDTKVTFEINGDVTNLGVDNGWESNVQPHKANEIITHNGRAILILQSTKKTGTIDIKATTAAISSNVFKINVQKRNN